jgi:hypothetical protein
VGAIVFQIAKLGQREQMPPSSGPCDARALRRLRGVQALSLVVKSLQNGQALGQAFDEIGFGNRHEYPVGLEKN